MLGQFDEKNAPLRYACPACGATRGGRCRVARRDWLNRLTLYDNVSPHTERIMLAWRAWLADAGGMPERDAALSE
jgi:hypothetical protein